MSLLLNPRVLIALALAAVLAFSHFAVYRSGKASVRAEWDAERVQVQAEVQQQRDRNNELQRAAEKKYTVQSETRDRFIVQTGTEVRHETANLAACVLTPAARGLLERAAECARENRPASCGADEQVRESGRPS